MKMCIAHRLLLSTSEISDATASMPSPGYFALQHRVAPPRKAYSLTSSAFIAFGALYPFSLFKPVFRGSLTSYSSVLGCDSGTSWKLPWTTASASASAMQSARSSAGSGSVKSFAHMLPSRANVLLASARGAMFSTARFSWKSSAIDAQPAEARSYSLSWSS